MPLRPPNSARPPNKKNHSAIRMGAISAEAMEWYRGARKALLETAVSVQAQSLIGSAVQRSSIRITRSAQVLLEARGWGHQTLTADLGTGGFAAFLEAPPDQPTAAWDEWTMPRVVHAPHWYDGVTLFLKQFVPFLGVDAQEGTRAWGSRRVERSFAAQLARVRTEASERGRGVPTLIGEFGIPFDLAGGRAYRTGDFRHQVRAMDRTFRALEANLLSGTLWNYASDNDNERGDQWNGEDLSIFSRDQQHDPADPDSGGRALEAVVRPYARAVAGLPLKMSYDVRRRAFELVFRHDPAVEAPTEIYLPVLHYPHGYRVEVSDGEYEASEDEHLLLYRHDPGRPEHWLRLRPRP